MSIRNHFLGTRGIRVGVGHMLCGTYHWKVRGKGVTLLYYLPVPRVIPFSEGGIEMRKRKRNLGTIELMKLSLISLTYVVT